MNEFKTLLSRMVSPEHNRSANIYETDMGFNSPMKPIRKYELLKLGITQNLGQKMLLRIGIKE